MSVYDFTVHCCQFDTLETRMDTESLFTTLIAQNKVCVLTNIVRRT
jgi:hypothetical protein